MPISEHALGIALRLAHSMFSINIYGINDWINVSDIALGTGEKRPGKKMEKDSKGVSAFYHRKKTTTGYLHVRRWEVQGKGFWLQFLLVRQDSMGVQ